MITDQWMLNNPREAVRASDSWTRRVALAALLKSPQTSDREIFEENIDSDDLTLSLLSFLGLKKLFPAPAPTRAAWKEIFGESVDLLSRRACVGPAQMRVAALKSLAFAPEHLSVGLVERVLKSLDSPVSYETVSSGQTPALSLVQKPHRFFLPEGFALLLASLPGGHERVRLLQQELYSEDPARLLPVLIALQIQPVAELSDQLLKIARSADQRVKIEAARALLACGGNRVFLLILSLLKETSEPGVKSLLLPLAANTGREEVWPVICKYAASDESQIVQAALRSADIFPAPVEEKIAIYREGMKSADSAVATLAARFAWQGGSMKALRILENGLISSDKKWRMHSAAALGHLSSETAIPLLSQRFDNERSGDVIRQMILSLRRLLPLVQRQPRVHDVLIPWFSRLLRSADAFKRSQCAVLAGLIGKAGVDLLLKALEKEQHPHVVASLLGALGRNGVDRLLVYSLFHDHPDSRVRANMISAMLACGAQAMSYFSAALKDESPRVRSAAARNLFLLGQLEIVGTLNRMLLVPEPVSVLSGCFGLGQLLRIQPPLLDSDHPLPLSVSRKIRLKHHDEKFVGPALLDAVELPQIFREMALVGGSRKKIAWVLDEKLKRMPSLHPVRRMLAAFLALNADYERSSSLIAAGIRQCPNILADLLDIYRLSLKMGNLDAASDYGKKARQLYGELLNGCTDLCRHMRGGGASMILERLHHLKEPSMNLYNAMIQLKVIEGELETVLDLMAELVLARPQNPFIVRKLASLLPESRSELKTALTAYASSLPELT